MTLDSPNVCAAVEHLKPLISAPFLLDAMVLFRLLQRQILLTSVLFFRIIFEASGAIRYGSASAAVKL